MTSPQGGLDPRRRAPVEPAGVEDGIIEQLDALGYIE